MEFTLSWPTINVFIAIESVLVGLTNFAAVLEHLFLFERSFAFMKFHFHIRFNWTRMKSSRLHLKLSFLGFSNHFWLTRIVFFFKKKVSLAVYCVDFTRHYWVLLGLPLGTTAVSVHPFPFV